MLSGIIFSEEQETIRAVPMARWMAKKEEVTLSLVKGSGPNGIVLVKDIKRFKITQEVTETTGKTGGLQASSLALKLAEKQGVFLEKVDGTGPHGKIMMRDVIKVIEKQDLPVDKKRVFGQAFPMTQMRRVIANRMAKSAFTAPHIHFFTEVEMDKLSQLREDIQLGFEKRFNIRISFNDFFIKAVALTICEYPILNAVVKGEEIYIMPEINIGLAVALEEGLIVPAIPQSEQLSLGKIAQIRSDLVERARVGKLKLEEIERGTFTISSLAQFDITYFTAILNPPQSGILSIGKTFDHLALKDDQLIIKKKSYFGLSVDHRVIDGAVAAAFLQSLKYRLEHPTTTFMSF